MAALGAVFPFSAVQLHPLWLVLLGFAVGVLAGFFGIGGGWVATPALNVLGFPMPFAVGTGLAAVAGQGAMAAAKHRRLGNVSVRLGLVVGVGMVAGVEAGARLLGLLEARGLAGTVVRWFYVAALAGLGLHMGAHTVAVLLRGGHGQVDARRGRRPAGIFRLPPTMALGASEGRVSVWLVASLGVVVGCLAGLMGAGGGFALVPAFIYLVGVPTRVAVGTSLLCVLISGAYGTFTYALRGWVEPFAALWMLAGAAGGVQVGVAAVQRVRGGGIRLLYALMLLLAAGGVLLRQVGYEVPARAVIFGGAVAICMVILGAAVVAGTPERTE